jgi:hypothetical protein
MFSSSRAALSRLVWQLVTSLFVAAPRLCLAPTLPLSVVLLRMLMQPEVPCLLAQVWALAVGKFGSAVALPGLEPVALCGCAPPSQNRVGPLTYALVTPPCRLVS